MPAAGVSAKPITLLLAVAVGAILAAAAFLATTPVERGSGGVASARVLSTASCADRGRDTITVSAPAGPVTTRLDGCGHRVGSTLVVDLGADGSVPDPAPLAGTRGAAGGSALPLAVLGACAVAIVGLGFGALRWSSARTPPAWQG